MADEAAYHVVFDLVQQGYAPPWLELVIYGLPVVLLLYALASSRTSARGILEGVALVVFAALLTVVLITHWHDYQLLRRAAPEYIWVEGHVVDFVTDRGGGVREETFRVNDHYFEVHFWRTTAGFRQTVGLGGPDLSGKCVRLAYAPDRLNVNRITWLGVRECP